MRLYQAPHGHGSAPNPEPGIPDPGAPPERHPQSLPDYLPARMLNEFVYCPRLFYYMWVDSLFAENRETVEGSIRHRKIDAKSDPLPSAKEAADGVKIHSQSVTLSSDTHGLIAKMDLIEGDAGLVTPVDYKRGRPRESSDGSPAAWDPERVQIAAQALVLRDNGYHCEEGVIYYSSTKQRVRVPIDDELVALTLEALNNAKATALGRTIPPPLIDSPKCPRCSLVGICLPDETTLGHTLHPPGQKQLFLFETESADEPEATAELAAPKADIRKLVAARDDLRPLYLNTQGLRVGKSGNVLKVQEKDKVVQEVRTGEICQLNLLGNIQITTQAVQTLCECDVPIAYFSQGGWFYGLTEGLGLKNIFLRREQFRLADVPSFCLRLARALVAGKIRNQRTMLQRNHIEAPTRALDMMRCLYDDASQAESLEQLLGIEGNAARWYFQNFAGMIKVSDELAGDADASGWDRPNRRRNIKVSDELAGDADGAEGGSKEAEPGTPSSAGSTFSFNFKHRNRRPPRDPVNALLSLAYSMLTKDLTIVCRAVGFDPFLGFYHQPRFGRPALALDLMEPFRPLIADSAVLTAINTRMVSEHDFIRAAESVALTPNGRKAFFRAYEQRMDTLATHPLFGYRVSYRRLLEIQARLLGRLLTGELTTYPVFTTR